MIAAKHQFPDYEQMVNLMSRAGVYPFRQDVNKKPYTFQLTFPRNLAFIK